MRRVVGSIVAIVAVLSSGAAFASSNAVADLQFSIRALAKDAKPVVVDPVRSVDLGLSGVNVTREARTGVPLAPAAADPSAAASPTAGMHH